MPLSKPTRVLTSRTLPVTEIREGDEFHADGTHYWTAYADATAVRRGNEWVIAIDVQHFPDRGLATRYWNADDELTIKRPRVIAGQEN